MKRKLWVTAGTAGVVLYGVSAASAAYQDSVAVHNHICTGDIKIGIREYETTEKAEKIYDTSVERLVLPSQEISKIPRITNYAEPCFVRVRIGFQEEKPEKDSGQAAETEVKKEILLSEQDLSGMTDDWIKAGEYFYLTEPLENGESSDVFRAVTIPADWDSEASGAVLKLSVQAEAVQAEGFFPDFFSADPWKGTEAEICIHEQNGSVQEIEKRYQSMSVIYEGDAGELVAVPDDFFSNLEAAMPGQSLSDTVDIRNTTDAEAEFFFRTEVPENITEQERELLQKFGLKIDQNGAILYSGDLYSDSLQNNKISLGVLQADEESSLHFSLSLPESLKNDFAKRESRINWIFSVRGEDGKPISVSGKKQIQVPQTGDRVPYEMIILFLMGSAGVIFCILRGKRGDTE